MHKIYKILPLLLLTQLSLAQLHQDVFPSLSDSQLFDSLLVHYKPDSVLVWGDAKDTIFAVIDNLNDTVVCVYTGLEKWLDPSQDPSDFMGMNNDPNGMNIEHTYPQSKGAASGNARADMHHLFPSRNETNNMRGNLPFDELNDTLVTNWFFTSYNAQGIPAFNIDAYSELILNQAFEPKEDWKGNVARAMFYFYSMYRNEANGADPNYFDLQKEILCDWHLQDPVDQMEWDRTYKVATYQDNKPNPFVLDCSLARRMYCPNQVANCIPTGLETQLSSNSFRLEKLFPNPSNGQVQLNYQLKDVGQIRIELYNSLGQQVCSLLDTEQEQGRYTFVIDKKDTENAGLYFLKISFKTENKEVCSTHKILWTN